MRKKMIDKVIILGIDSLEYDFVNIWNLNNLKQIEYGKTNLPISKKDGYYYSEPATILIWPSIITGYTPKKNGIDTLKIYPLNNLYKKYLKFNKYNINNYHKINTKTIKNYKTSKRKILDKISKLLSIMNISRIPRKSDIKTTTIFDDIPNSFHFHIPIYDEDAFPYYKKKILDAIEDKTYKPIFELECKKEFKNRTQEIINFLNEDHEWNLIMQYFYVLDGIQHVYFNNIKKIAKFYIMFDEFVGKMKKLLDENTLILILSDHGQKNGIHTNYGYYSSNKKIGLKNPNVINFRWKIEELIKKNIKLI